MKRRQRHEWRIETTGGEQARKKAEADLERVCSETKKWEALGNELREIRRRNHLAETFIKATGGRT